MAPYVAPNRQRFIVPPKILNSAASASPIHLDNFPVERFPFDILTYLLAEHVPLPDLICLALSCKRFLYLLTDIDRNAVPILHYPSRPDTKASVLAPFSAPKFDPSAALVSVLRRLQAHEILPLDSIACHSCCKVRALGTEAAWWDLCEEIYSSRTWRRRRNDRNWSDRRLVDFEYAEFQSVFAFVWKRWRRHKPSFYTVYGLKENTNGQFEVKKQHGAAKGSKDVKREDLKQKENSAKTMTKTQLLGPMEDGPKAVCPECWAEAEAKSIAKRPPMKNLWE